MILFYPVFAFIILQRIVELLIANKNRNRLLTLGAVEYDNAGYKYIVMLHVLFLCSLFIENIIHGQFNVYSIYIFILFVLAQLLRYWSITSLGVNWNTKILIIPGSNLIKKGPYKYFNHPNYIAVILEFFSIPLIFSLYYSGLIFSVLNLFVISRRIKIENAALFGK